MAKALALRVLCFVGVHVRLLKPERTVMGCEVTRGRSYFGASFGKMFKRTAWVRRCADCKEIVREVAAP